MLGGAAGESVEKDYLLVVTGELLWNHQQGAGSFAVLTENDVALQTVSGCIDVGDDKILLRRGEWCYRPPLTDAVAAFIGNAGHLQTCNGAALGHALA